MSDKLVEATSNIGRALISAMPPAFLMLCVVNVVFLYIVMGFMERQADQRVQLVAKLVDHCMQQRERKDAWWNRWTEPGETRPEIGKPVLEGL